MKKFIFLSSLILGLAVCFSSCNKGDDDEVVIPKKSYTVGQYYNEDGATGIVYEISADGTSGKIVALENINGKFAQDTVSQISRGATSTTDGMGNCKKFIDAGQDFYPTIKATNALSPKGKWYIPAIDELTAMLKACDTQSLRDSMAKYDGASILKVVPFQSSTEANASAMYITTVSTLEQPVAQFKNGSLTVRPIMKF